MYIIIVACIFSVAFAGVLPEQTQPATFYENTNDGKGNYRFSFVTAHGIYREESGRLVNVGEKNEHMVVEGSYSYTDPDGKLEYVQYTADENGYHILDPEQSQNSTSVSFALPASAVATLLGK